MRTVRWILALLVVAACCGAAAAQQQESLGDAARRARQQRAKAPKATHEWTNDNIPTSGGALSVVGSGAAAPSAGGEGAGAGAGATGGAAGAGESDELAAAQGELSALKQKLATAQKDLDLLGRDYDLQRQQFYSNPGYSSDSAGKARLDALEAQRNAKLQEVEGLKQQISALEDKLKTLQANAPAKPQEPASADQQRAEWQAKIRPLREELARVDDQLSHLTTTTGASDSYTAQGDFSGLTADNRQRLTARKRELEQQIAAIEDDARRAGIPAAWLR